MHKYQDEYQRLMPGTRYTAVPYSSIFVQKYKTSPSHTVAVGKRTVVHFTSIPHAGPNTH